MLSMYTGGTAGLARPRDVMFHETDDRELVVLAFDQQLLRPDRHRQRSSICRSAACTNFGFGEGSRDRLVCFDSLDRDIAAGKRLRAADRRETVDAIIAMGAGKHLDIELPGCGMHQTPHIGHHGEMQAGINLIDEQHAAGALRKNDGERQHMPGPVAQAASGMGERSPRRLTMKPPLGPKALPEPSERICSIESIHETQRLKDEGFVRRQLNTVPVPDQLVAGKKIS